MKILFAFIFCMLLFTCGSNAQAKLGEVACVYVTSADPDSSLSVYEKLGFAKTASNNFPSPWVQVSDGNLLIMIRKDANHYMGLTYYSNDVDNIASALEKDGIVFIQKPKEGDPIKRYYFKSPDGFNIMLASNLGGFQQPKGTTMLNMKQEDYQSENKYPNKQCGVFGEYCHPVTDLDASIAYWKKIGFEVKYKETAPEPYAILSDGLMIIGLHKTKTFNYPAITYFGLDTDKKIDALKQKGLSNFSEIMGKKNQVLKTWEGQHFFIFSMGM